jgi:hypothetical protein
VLIPYHADSMALGRLSAAIAHLRQANVILPHVINVMLTFTCTGVIIYNMNRTRLNIKAIAADVRANTSKLIEELERDQNLHGQGRDS